MRNLLVLSLALNLSLIMRVFYEGEKHGPRGFSAQKADRALEKAAHATQRTLVSLSSSGQDDGEKLINLDQ